MLKDERCTLKAPIKTFSRPLKWHGSVNFTGDLGSSEIFSEKRKKERKKERFRLKPKKP